jgi:penicillin-binding protein 1A
MRSASPQANDNGVRTPFKQEHTPSRHKKAIPGGALRKILLFAVKWGIIAAIWAGIALGLVALYYARDLPNVSNLQEIKQTRKVTILAQDGTTLANFGNLQEDYATYESFPQHLIDAVVATEDRRFFSHFGIDPLGLLRAAYSNLRAGHVVQGGSTITQQLAKIMFLSSDRTMKRKLQEVILALYLEQKFTKKEILTIYLNRVYMGAGIYGVPAAAKYYFGKNIREINLYEAAMIAGLLKAPSRYSPTNSSTKAGHRTYQILVNMQDAGFISAVDLAKAKHNPIMLETSALGTMKNLYFADWVMEQVADFVTDTDHDLIVRTTLNSPVQQIAENALARALDAKGEKFNVSQGAVVVLSPDGKVLAMVGGRDYNKSPFNRALKAQRQPGSSFKLFVYLTAFEEGISPDDMMNDEPVKIKKWQPKNYEGKYLGTITIREAFYRSINTIAVQLADKVGLNNVISTAHKLGINSPIEPNPSIALGSTEVNLLELTGSYATLVNSGYAVWPYGIEQITTSNGKPLYRRQGSSASKVISDQALNSTLDVLSNVITQGTGKGAQLDRPAAGKTGTTNDYRDAWFIGMTADVVTGVWVGNDDNAPMKKVTGGGIPAQIWKEIMLAVNSSRPVTALMHGSGAYEEAKEHNDSETDHRESFWQELMDTIGGDGKVEYTYPKPAR